LRLQTQKLGSSSSSSNDDRASLVYFFFLVENVTKRKWRPSRLPEQFLLCATQTGCATFPRNIFVKFEAVVVFVFAAEKEKKLIIKYRHILEGGGDLLLPTSFGREL
jgi:hypothetical protein